MQVPLPWERLLWESQSWWTPHVRYVLTDFRLVGLEEGGAWEIALRDIREVLRHRTVLDRLTGTSTLEVCSRHSQHAPLTLRHIRRGAQLAALLELLASESTPSLDEDGVRVALSWPVQPAGGQIGQAVAAVAIVAAAVAAIAFGLQGEAASIAYPTNDAIYPRGVKRDRDAIARFMETTVLPWARETLGPLKGGADKVTCNTCHGPAPEARHWKMPAVAALPEPHVRPIGAVEDFETVDAQMRNAIYGYLAESDNQAKAGYMREYVVPGMARLLGRPAYDFTQTYEYNRTRFAIGCYHCHMVARPGSEAQATAAQ